MRQKPLLLHVTAIIKCSTSRRHISTIRITLFYFTHHRAKTSSRRNKWNRLLTQSHRFCLELAFPGQNFQWLGLFPAQGILELKDVQTKRITNWWHMYQNKKRRPDYTFCSNIILNFFIVYRKLQSTQLDRVISKVEVRKGREAGTIHRWFTGVVLLS